MASFGRNHFPLGFQWDPGKYDSNLAKWKVRFEVAARVFEDPLVDERIDTRFPYGEERFIAVGAVQGELLYVAFTMRGDDDELTHLISARRLLPKERKAYARARSQFLS